MNKVRATGRACSIPVSLGIGVAAGYGVVVLTGMIGALLLSKRIMEWRVIGYWIMAVLLLSSNIAAMVSMKLAKRQRGIVSLMTGITYIGIMMLSTALFFGAQYEAVGETTLLVSAGSGTALLMSKSSDGKRKYKVRIKG